MNKIIISIALALIVGLGFNIGYTVNQESENTYIHKEKYNDNLYFNPVRHNTVQKGNEVTNYFEFTDAEDKKLYENFLDCVINKSASFYSLGKYFDEVEAARLFLSNLSHTKEFYFSNAFDMTIIHGESYSIIIDIESANRAYNENIEIYNQLKEISNKIITDEMTESDCLVAINQYLTDTIVYNYEKKTLTDALNGEVRCSGYASLFKALAELNGIKTDIVVGQEKDSEIYHSWNKVYLNGEEIYFDPTYNDGSSSTKYSFLTEEGIMQDRTYIDETTYLLRDGIFAFVDYI